MRRGRAGQGDREIQIQIQIQLVAHLQLEAGFVQRVGEHREDILQQRPKELLVEGLADLRGVNLLQQLLADGEPELANVSLRVLEGPHDRVHRGLEDVRRLRGERHQRREAVLVDGLDQQVRDSRRGAAARAAVDILVEDAHLDATAPREQSADGHPGEGGECGPREQTSGLRVRRDVVRLDGVVDDVDVLLIQSIQFIEDIEHKVNANNIEKNSKACQLLLMHIVQ